MFNWLNQAASITLANLRTIPARKGAALATAVGIAGVVAVFVGVFAIADGFRQAMTASGSDDIAIVMRSGADSEMSRSSRMILITFTITWFIAKRLITKATGFPKRAHSMRRSHRHSFPPGTLSSSAMESAKAAPWTRCWVI